MTDQEIIAEKFMEWRKENVGTKMVPAYFWVNGSGEWQRAVHNFDPLHDPSACALILDELERRGWSWREDYKVFPYNAAAPHTFSVWIGNKQIQTDGYAWADTRYRAVCLAVLRALGVEV